MDNFNVIDCIVIAIILLSSVLAYSRGVVRELMAILGWIVSAVVAFSLAPHTLPLIKEIPIVGSILADSCELGIIASFATVFAVMLVLISFFTPLLSSLIDKTPGMNADRKFGFLFGILRGVILIAISFFAYKSVLSPGTFPLIEGSFSAIAFGDIVKAIEAQNPEGVMTWITIKYEELVLVCEN